MAGSVLIALIIIGALVLMFNSLSSYQNSNTKDVKDSQILEFNNQYLGYARNNVRGSDIYSLLNKVVDYNRRQSTSGTGTNNGQYLAYEPITITVKIRRQDLSKIYISDTETYSHLIGGTGSGDVILTASGISNSFSEGTELQSKIATLESTYGKDALNSLVESVTKIFLASSADASDKNDAKEAWNNICTREPISDYNELKEGSEKRRDVYQYYEYVQFKRAKFDCKNTEYSDGSGRIISMTFESNGKFE